LLDVIGVVAGNAAGALSEIVEQIEGLVSGPVQAPGQGKIVAFPAVGGLRYRYEGRAAWSVLGPNFGPCGLRRTRIPCSRQLVLLPASDLDRAKRPIQSRHPTQLMRAVFSQ
jgi:hypothetical protein